MTDQQKETTTTTETLTDAAREYCDYYKGNKAAWLGNGQALRSLIKFRELLARPAPAPQPALDAGKRITPRKQITPQSLAQVSDQTPLYECARCGTKSPSRCQKCGQYPLRANHDPAMENSHAWQGCCCNCGNEMRPMAALDAGDEWRLSSGNKRIVIDGHGQIVAECRPTSLNGEADAERRAAQIVSDHNATRVVAKLTAEIEQLQQEYEKVVDECGHWRAEAEHYAERPLEDFE